MKHPGWLQGTQLCGAMWLRILIGMLAWTLSAIGTVAQTRQRPPNIVLLVADDLGYGELGCQGNPQIPTPHIDALAASGVRCTHAYVTAPNCSPSRAGMFTGRIPTRFGYEFNPIGARNEDAHVGLPPSETTLAEMLHGRGYTTSLIGKWHLGGAADYHPQRHGFDHFFGFTHEGHYFVPPPWLETITMLRRRVLPAGSHGRHQVSNSLLYTSHMGHNEPAYDANNPVVRGGQPVQEPEYLTDAWAREAVDFVRQHQQTPFFMCVTFNAVHSPLQAKQETFQELSHIDDVHRRIFAAMLVDLDRAVGRITECIADCGLSQDTMIIFLSDNGGPTRELTSSNSPLRDGKGSMYEGGVRVPMIFSWPASLPAGEVCHQVVSSLDIMPTLDTLSRSGTRVASVADQWDGLDALPRLREPEKPTDPRQLYWRQGKRAALRSGEWKIVCPKSPGGQRQWELYNISSDISESQNLAERHPEKLTELLKLWQDMDAQMSEPRF